MKITYLGHSCFFIEGEYKIVTDPFSGIGYPLKRVSCNFVLSSHSHFDHNAICGVDYKTAVCDFEDVKAAKAIKLRAIESYHDECFGKKRGKNLIYQFELDGVTFTHLGDLGEGFSQNLVEKIGQTDVLFIPVGGTYTIDGSLAAKYVGAIKPSIAVPMHYKTPRCTVDICDKNEFVCNFKQVKYVENSITLNKADFKDGTTVCVFDSDNF